MGAAEATTRRDRPADRAVRAIELLTMCGLAIAAPVFSIMAGNTAELVQRRVTGLDLVVFAVLMVVVPPAVLWLVEELLGVVAPRAVRPVHVGVLSVLFAAFLMQFATGVGGVTAWLVLVVAVGAGVLFARLYGRIPELRTWLRWLAVAPPLFVLWFVALSPAARVVVGSPPPPAPAAAGEHPEVVMVVLDELPTLSLLRPDGTIDAERYPHFAELADTSTWYRDTTAAASWTLLAVPALLTGHYPNPDAAPIAADHPESLFTLLGGTYDLNVWESVTRLCPSELCPDRAEPPSLAARLGGMMGVAATVLRQRTSPFEEPEVRLQIEGVADSRDHATVFRDFVDSIESGDRPTLHFLHVELPHQPWSLLPSTETHDGPEVPPGLRDGNWWIDDASSAAGQQAHHLSLEAADELLGELLAHLHETGQFDESVVVVAADHGTAFTTGLPFRAITPDTVDQIAYPPLFVKAPGQTSGAVSDLPAQTVDVVPTVADLADVPVPWELDGVSLLDEDVVRGRSQRYRPVWVDDLPTEADGLATLPATPFEERVRRNAAVLEAVAGDHGLELLGEVPDLLGASVDDLPVADGPPEVATVGGAGVLRSVPDGGPVPAYVSMEFEESPGGPVAVAVDGTIVLVGRPGPSEPAWLWGFLPESSLVGPGQRRVTAWVVVEGDGDLAVRPVDLR